MDLSEDLDLDLAWRKTKRNLQRNKKVFINNPHIIDIIDRNSDEYINYLSDKIRNGYDPSNARIINSPKRDWKVRPASILKIDDITVYSAIVIELYEDIKDEIQWSAGSRRFSRILLDDLDNTRWMENSFETWKSWGEKSQELYDEYEFVLSTDITSFFENIEHHILYSHVRGINAEKPLRDLLWDCLSRWCLPKSRGLPQGYYPSNILSELYLDEIDRRIKRKGFMHTRYSDDLRIYCDTKEDAIEMLRELSELYRKKGLYLNKEKTEILTSKEAREKFKDPREEIKQIQPQIVDRIRRERRFQRKQIEAEGDARKRRIDDDIPYTDGGEIDQLDLDFEEETKLLETIFNNYIVESETFNKSLFKYLIGRLGDVNSQFAVPYCYEQIRAGKPHIRHIVDKYFSKLEGNEQIANKLLDTVLNEELHYDFQEFIIIRWVFESQIYTDEVVSKMRELLNRSYGITEIENYIIAYLGNYGDKTDLKIISEKYPESSDNVKKSIILFAIRNRNPELRGPIYSRAEGDHPYCEFAVNVGKSLSS